VKRYFLTGIFNLNTNSLVWRSKTSYGPSCLVVRGIILLVCWDHDTMSLLLLIWLSSAKTAGIAHFLRDCASSFFYSVVYFFFSLGRFPIYAIWYAHALSYLTCDLLIIDFLALSFDCATLILTPLALIMRTTLSNQKRRIHRSVNKTKYYARQASTEVDSSNEELQIETTTFNLLQKLDENWKLFVKIMGNKVSIWLITCDDNHAKWLPRQCHKWHDYDTRSFRLFNSHISSVITNERPMTRDESRRRRLIISTSAINIDWIVDVNTLI